MKLHPIWNEPGAVAALTEHWEETRNLRIEPLLAEEVASELLERLESQPYRLQSASRDGALALQYWGLGMLPGGEMADFVTWLHGDLGAWIAGWTRRKLAPPADGQLLSTLYTKGCYLDPHNDYDGERELAYVLGLTPASWPAEEGGWLEFLEPSGRTIGVAERRPPGWNTLDLFDVSQPTCPAHRVSLLTGRQHRRVVAGWYYAGK